MMIDSLKNTIVSSLLAPSIVRALEFLQDNPIHEFKPGRHEMGIPGTFLLIQHYQTRPRDEAFWEAHRDHIDIQYMIEGEERMGYSDVSNLRVTEDLLVEKDYMVLEGDGDLFTVREGQFAIFLPQDAHMPCVSVKAAESVKKAVVKIRVGNL